MIAYGFGFDGDYISDFLLLDLATGASCPLLTGEDPVVGAEAAFSRDRLAVCGGFRPVSAYNAADCIYYDREAFEWQQQGNMEYGRVAGRGAVLSNGDWIMTGGKLGLKIRLKRDS